MTAIVVQMSTGRAVSGYWKSAGRTPATTYGFASSMMDRPTMSLLPPKRDFHNWWLRITTRVPGLSSVAAKVRPNIGVARKTSNRFAVAMPASRWRGSPSPVSVNELLSYAATDSKAWVCDRKSEKSGKLSGRSSPVRRSRPRSATSRWLSGKGSGWRITALTTLKIAVFAPMPSARVRTTIAVKPGLLPSTRSA